MTETTNSLMEFPCHFPIKVIGINSSNFTSDVTHIARKHFPALLDTDIQIQSSKNQNYLALTITVLAHTQKSLDALYLELTQHPDIKMVL